MSGVLSLTSDGGFQNEVAQVRAKSVLTRISEETQEIQWTYVAPRLLRNLTAALLEIKNSPAHELEASAEIKSAAHRVAQVWESIALLEEGVSRTTALISAAASYEFAGYQANAAYIARQIVPRPERLEVPSTTELAALFLQRLMVSVRQLARRALEEPDAESLTVDSIALNAGRGLVAKALSDSAAFFLGGSRPALAEALDSLRLAERVFAQAPAVREANLVGLLTALLPIMASRSTWSRLQHVVPDNPRWVRYLKLLARGTGREVLYSPSVSELWPSQLTALESGLFSDTSLVLRMPTSAGKTRVAELAIAHSLITRPGSKCVYIAPYRALVSELEDTFLTLFADLGLRVSSIVGTFETDVFEQSIALDADLLVVTPEKMDLLFRLQPELLEQVRLIILDEGQIVHDWPRGPKFELLLTRLKRRLPNARFLFLSAVVPDVTLQDFAKWFNCYPQGVIQSAWRPAIQRHGLLQWRGRTAFLTYAPSDDLQTFGGFVKGVIRSRTYTFRNRTTGRINRRQFPEVNHKAQTAAETAIKFAELGPVLVFCTQTNWVEAVGDSILTRLLYTELEGESFPGYFRTANTRSAILAKEWLGEEHQVSRLLRSGVAVHHGRIPEVIRKAVESDFREKRYRVIVATNTLAQGVNLPIRTVVIHSTWRVVGEEEFDRLSARDYWNIAGRAGRAGEETEGTVIHIAVSPRDRQEFEYYLGRRGNLEPVLSALYRALRALVEERLSPSVLADALDAEILALLAEEEPARLEFLITEILNDTLVAVQASRTNLSLESLRSALMAGAQQIIQNIPDQELRRLYSSTGLRSQSCLLFASHARENASRLTELFLQARPSDREELARILLDACLTVPEMQAEAEFAGSISDLLVMWLGGQSIEQIRDTFPEATRSPEQLTRFIEDAFRYRLPWGMAAYIRIATRLLEIDSNRLSALTKFFPSMVKHGVPIPEASWAMTLGIPLRELSMKMASKYLEQNPSDYYAFVEWIRSLSSEDLVEEFGVSSPVLEDVSRSLYRIGGQTVLRDFSGLPSVLPTEVEVRGINYQQRQRVAIRASLGAPVDLRRDYDNAVDRNAVLVLLEGDVLGYLPRATGALLAPEMDAGMNFVARVTRVVDDGGTRRIWVTITILSSGS